MKQCVTITGRVVWTNYFNDDGDANFLVVLDPALRQLGRNLRCQGIIPFLIDIRHVYERYVAKSDPHTLMVSTPNAPNQLFESIEKEPEERYTYIIETIEERGG